MKKALSVALALCMVFALCSSAFAEWTPPEDMTFYAGATAGGGMDKFIRNVGAVLNQTGIVEETIKYDNVIGAAGLVLIGECSTSRDGDQNTVISGTGVLVPNEVSGENGDYAHQADLTPICRLITETTVLVCASDNNEVDTIEKLAAKLQADPTSVTFGGTIPPGEDYLSMILVLKELGVDVSQVNYVYYNGGGETLPALLGGNIDVSFSSASKWAAAVESGQVKPIAVAAPEGRLGGIYADTPTFREQGVDFVWQNWRGLIAPTNIPEEEVQYWREACEKMVETDEWAEVCANLSYESSYLGDEFQDFIYEYEAKCEEALKAAGLME